MDGREMEGREEVSKEGIEVKEGKMEKDGRKEGRRERRKERRYIYIYIYIYIHIYIYDVHTYIYIHTYIKKERLLLLGLTRFNADTLRKEGREGWEEGRHGW